MFTIGRQREKQHAAKFARNDADKLLVERVIDAAHDLMEGIASPDTIAPVLAEAFVIGGSGAWEQVGSWLHQLAHEHPALSKIWVQLAPHRSAKIRFRVSACLNEMPADIRLQLASIFLSDPSPRVRSKTAGEIYMRPTPDMLPLLQNRLAQESDGQVVSSIRLALSVYDKIAA